jgi:hypothetical protein
MYESNDKDDKIKEAEEELYSKNPDGIFVKRRHVLQEKSAPQEPTAWNIKEDKPESNFKIPYTKILIGAFIFFVLAMVFTFSKFFFGANVVSGNNIDILIGGPASIAGGEVLPLDIQVKNNNSTDLQVVDLHIAYPDGTKDATDQTTDLKNFEQTLGDISAGQSKEILTKAILFGQENSQETVNVTVQYRIPGSNAVFSKEKDFVILISSSPVNISISGPTEVNSNQTADFSIEVDSNSASIVKNLILKIDYPFGFTFSSSDPSPASSDNSVFNLGDLSPGEKRIIKVSGVVQGQDGEERVFKFTVGNPSPTDSTVVETAFASYVSTISLMKSSVGVAVSVNDQTGDNTAVEVGNKNTFKIDWQNNLAQKVYDMSVNVKINGQTLDQGSVVPDSGFYDSSNNTIVFDKSGNSLLETVNPSDQGSTQFTFNTLPFSSDSSIPFGNSTITFDISVLGSLAGSDGSNNQEVLYSDTQTVKISSELNLLARGFKTSGLFENYIQNSGPFPPQANSESTYVITWTASDSFNNINGAVVSANLPPNVTWTGNTGSSTENISYDPGTGEVTWNIGNMQSGVGLNSSPRQVSFQVAVTPSITQVGQELNLLNESTIRGTDVFTGAVVGENKDIITTNITSDPAYVDDIGKVVPQSN